MDKSIDEEDKQEGLGSIIRNESSLGILNVDKFSGFLDSSALDKLKKSSFLMSNNELDFVAGREQSASNAAKKIDIKHFDWEAKEPRHEVETTMSKHCVFLQLPFNKKDQLTNAAELQQESTETGNSSLNTLPPVQHLRNHLEVLDRILGMKNSSKVYASKEAIVAGRKMNKESALPSSLFAATNHLPEESVPMEECASNSSTFHESAVFYSNLLTSRKLEDSTVDFQSNQILARSTLLSKNAPNGAATTVKKSQEILNTPGTVENLATYSTSVYTGKEVSISSTRLSEGKPENYCEVYNPFDQLFEHKQYDHDVNSEIFLDSGKGLEMLNNDEKEFKIEKVSLNPTSFAESDSWLPSTSQKISRPSWMHDATSNTSTISVGHYLMAGSEPIPEFGQHAFEEAVRKGDCIALNEDRQSLLCNQPKQTDIHNGNSISHLIADMSLSDGDDTIFRKVITDKMHQNLNKTWNYSIHPVEDMFEIDGSKDCLPCPKNVPGVCNNYGSTDCIKAEQQEKSVLTLPKESCKIEASCHPKDRSISSLNLLENMIANGQRWSQERGLSTSSVLVSNEFLGPSESTPIQHNKDGKEVLYSCVSTINSSFPPSLAHQPVSCKTGMVAGKKTDRERIFSNAATQPQKRCPLNPQDEKHVHPSQFHLHTSSMYGMHLLPARSCGGCFTNFVAPPANMGFPFTVPCYPYAVGQPHSVVNHPSAMSSLSELSCSSGSSVQSNLQITGPISHWLEVPSVENFPDVVCVGDIIRHNFPLHNPTFINLQYSISVLKIEVDGQVQNENQGIVLPSDVSIPARTTKLIPISITPRLEGKTLIYIKISPALPHMPLSSLVTLDVLVEKPKIVFEAIEKGKLDFGHVLEGSQYVRFVTLRNMSTSSIPINLSIYPKDNNKRHKLSFKVDELETPEMEYIVISPSIICCRLSGKAGSGVSRLRIPIKLETCENEDDREVLKMSSELIANLHSSKASDRLTSMEITATVVSSSLLVTLLPQNLPVSIQIQNKTRTSKKLQVMNISEEKLTLQFRIIGDDAFSVNSSMVDVLPRQHKEILISLLGLGLEKTYSGFLDMVIKPSGIIQRIAVLQGSVGARCQPSLSSFLDNSSNQNLASSLVDSMNSRYAQKENFPPSEKFMKQFSTEKRKGCRSIIQCNKKTIVWGGVAVGEAKMREVTFKNPTNQPMEYKLIIKQNDQFYMGNNRLIEHQEQSIMLGPGEKKCISLTFRPRKTGPACGLLCASQKGKEEEVSELKLWAYGGLKNLSISNLKSTSERFYLLDYCTLQATREIVLHNSGNWMMFVKIACFIDKKLKHQIPKDILAVHPNIFILKEDAEQRITITGSIVHKLVPSILAVFSIDEIARAKVKRILSAKDPSDAIRYVRHPFSISDFTETLPGENELSENYPYPDTLEDIRIFYQNFTRMEIIMCDSETSMDETYFTTLSTHTLSESFPHASIQSSTGKEVCVTGTLHGHRRKAVKPPLEYVLNEN